MAITAATLQVRGLGKQKMNELAAQATRLGMTPEQYVKNLVEENLSIAREARTKTFAQIMGPGREVDEAEIDKLVKESKTRYHRRNKRRSHCFNSSPRCIRHECRLAGPDQLQFCLRARSGCM